MGEEEDHGDAASTDCCSLEILVSWPACSTFDAPDRAGACRTTVPFDSNTERASSLLAAACEEVWKGQREAAAEAEEAAAFVIVVAFAFALASGNTPPSPWKNE